MQEILAKLDEIAMLLRQMPEVEAATQLLMREELDEARLQGLKASDLWSLSPRDQRGTQ